MFNTPVYDKHAKIYVAGHQGLVGSALLRQLKSFGYENIVTKTREELDLRNSHQVTEFFSREIPHYVFLAAAKVGGIKANSQYPAEFLYDNIMIEANVIHASYLYGVKKLLFLGSSCIYPRECPQPIKEEYLLSGPLETTNEPYALAKIAGLKLCQAYNTQYGTRFISAMPTNLYGPYDMFDAMNSHVIPSLLLNFHRAKMNGDTSVTVWGSGKPLREFLFVDDLARALIKLMHEYEENSWINIGSSEEISIHDLAFVIKKVVNFDGDIIFDTSQPDGTPRKFLDSSRMRTLGWKPLVALYEGLSQTYTWFLKNKVNNSKYYEFTNTL